MKTKGYILIGLLVVVIMVSLYFIRVPYQDYLENRIIEFDNKWKPLCENLGGLYLESGMNHVNNCYINNSGALYKTIIMELNGEYYLKGDCFYFANSGGDGQ